MSPYNAIPRKKNLVVKQSETTYHDDQLKFQLEPPKKSGKSNKPVVIDAHEESSVNSDSKEQAKQFSKFKKKILHSIPRDVRVDFKQIGFVKWDGHYHCVLQLGPFDVCPGEVRDLWMKMYHEVSVWSLYVSFKVFLKFSFLYNPNPTFLLYRVQRLKKSCGKPFSRLVYWYGAELNQAFSLIGANKIIPYEEGIERRISEEELNRIRRKMRHQQKLTANEKLIRRNWKEAKADSLLSPEKRSEWLFDFKEDHEEESNHESSDDSSSESESDESSVNSEMNESLNKKGNIRHHSAKKSKDDSPSKDKIGETRIERAITASDDNLSTSDSASSKSSSKKKRKRDELKESSSIVSNVVKEQRQETDDTVDLRILLKPQSDEKMGGKNKSKLYDIIVQQNGETIAKSELCISDQDKSVATQLKSQNITFNLSFKL